MDKSPEAFRTISEVADFLDTPAHVLRFWESRFPQIRPVKRAGGRRYYRPGDVALLAGIKKLLHDEGLTIRGVQKILREQGIRHVAGLGSTDGAAAVDDADIEAVLSAEYGPKDQFNKADEPSSEALQSAQIISLETALNRQDTGRTLPPVQADLWPPAPTDQPAEVAGIWPSDPADAAPAANLFEAEAEVSEGSDRDLESTANIEAEPLVKDSAPAVAMHGSDAAAVSPADPIAQEPAADGATQADSQEVVDSQAVESAAESDADVADANWTVATLLRRTSPDHVASIQPDLIRLRDRLMTLRTQVAEAARRRAK